MLGAVVELAEAVEEAVSWAFESESSHAAALAALATSLATEISNPPTGDKPPPTAALAKELRATLEDLEGLRDGDDADASLGLVLSSPVWDASKSGPANARPARRKSVGKSQKAADAVAAPRRGRSA